MLASAGLWQVVRVEHPPDPLRRVVRALCTTQIVAWGVLFYAFPVVASSISADEGWP